MKELSEADVDLMAAARSEANPGARLLHSARRLFNEQGYAAAGINEIIAAAGASKKSFYTYFPAKHDLGAAYLRAEEGDLQRLMNQLARRHGQDFRGFIHGWRNFISRRAQQRRFFGCPFARMAAQAPQEFAPQLPGIVTRWRRELERYLASCDLALTPAEARQFSRQILVLYQGAVQMWRITGELAYFRNFEAGVLAALTVERRRRRNA